MAPADIGTYAYNVTVTGPVLEDFTATLNISTLGRFSITEVNTTPAMVTVGSSNITVQVAVATSNPTMERWACGPLLEQHN